jgi:hypothetical protein
LRQQWCDMYELLTIYRQEKNHVSPVIDEDFHGRSLGKWVANQRFYFHQLSLIGFEFRDPTASSVKSKEGQKCGKVSPDTSYNNESNAATQKKKNGEESAASSITDKSLGKTESGGRNSLHKAEAASCNSEISKWDAIYHLLKDYATENNHMCPPTREKYKGANLGIWVRTQRLNYSLQQQR